MTDRNTFRFIGHITAVTSLTVTRPDEGFPSPPNSPFKLSRKAGRLPRMGALREETPVYFPATSLRGAIRRAGRNMIRRAVIKQTGKQTPWSVDTHYMLTQGVDTTNRTLNEKTAGVIGVEHQLRDANPFLSLFGRWKLPGHLGIDNAIPENTDCVYVEGRGARSNDFTRDPEQIQFLSTDEALRLKRILEQDALAAEETGEIDQQIKQLKKDLRSENDSDEKEEIKHQIDELEARRKAVKGAKEGAQESIQRPLEGFEAIIPGTRLMHSMSVENASLLELGLFLACLREFSRKPRVGGHRNLNCGEIKAEWAVRYWPEDAPSAIEVGVVKLSADSFEVNDAGGHSILSEALSIWESASNALDENGINFERFLMVE